MGIYIHGTVKPVALRSNGQRRKTKNRVSGRHTSSGIRSRRQQQGRGPKMRPGRLTGLEPEGKSFQRQVDMPQRPVVTVQQMVTSDLRKSSEHTGPCLSYTDVPALAMWLISFSGIINGLLRLTPTLTTTAPRCDSTEARVLSNIVYPVPGAQTGSAFTT